MMKPLRKRHLQIWTAWALLLPVGIIAAWLVIQDIRPVKLLQSQPGTLLPVIRSTDNKNAYTVNLRSNEQGTDWQLEWKNKTPLTVPSAVIYKISPAKQWSEVMRSFKIEDAQLIGRIEARGDYRFPLTVDGNQVRQARFVLYDFIHQVLIDSLNFQL